MTSILDICAYSDQDPSGSFVQKLTELVSDMHCSSQIARQCGRLSPMQLEVALIADFRAHQDPNVVGKSKWMQNASSCQRQK